MKWTKDELDALIKINNTSIEKDELLSMFNNKSTIAIKKKSNKLSITYKIKKHHHKEWGQNETTKLLMNRDSSKTELINMFPDRTWNSISSRLGIFNVNRNIKRRWNGDEIKYLKENYANYPKKDLIKMFAGRSWEAIKIEANKLNIKRKYDDYKTHKLEKLLEEIPESYYWIGFLLADGSFCNHRLKLALAEKDCSSVIMFAEYINAKNNMHNYNRISQVSVKDIEIVPSICKKFNIKKNKTKNPPLINIIDDNLFLCLLIGYIDGDGSIRKHPTCKSFCITFHVHASWMETLTMLKLRLNNILNIQSNDTPHIDKNGYACWTISNSEICKKLKNTAISNNLPFMKRKWVKINMDYVSQQKVKSQ